MGWGVIGSDVVDLGVAYFSLVLTLYSVFTEHNKMPEIYPNLCLKDDDLVSYFISQF